MSKSETTRRFEMETKYTYVGTALGNFEFTGTLTEWQQQLSQLREVSPEFNGEITTGSALSDFREPGEKKYADCLFYNGDKIAEAVED
jgi:hypothetical protein